MTRSLQPRLARLVVALTLAAGVGCSDSTGPGSLVGLYILRAVDGISLPVIIAQDVDYTEEMLSGEVRLEADGTFADVTATRITSSGEIRVEIVEATGTWRLQGDDVVFDLGGGRAYTMAYERRTLTQNWFGFELLYSK